MIGTGEHGVYARCLDGLKAAEWQLFTPRGEDSKTITGGLGTWKA